MNCITLKEASNFWSISPHTINYCCTAGRIPDAMKIATI